jgi:release factor glutamine methyltransferase
VHEISFSGLRLVAQPGRVMTPRSASEQLVEQALELVGDRPARVIDVGTGSGAIAIAIAAAAPQVEVWATDTSCCAVGLARLNVRRHRLDGRVTVRHGDLLDSVPGAFDVIVANLPYLPRLAARFHPDLETEPADAVFADGDGLEPYRRLLAESPARLSADGALAIQLHRRVLVASRAELPELRAALGDSAAGVDAWAPALVAAAA